MKIGVAVATFTNKIVGIKELGYGLRSLLYTRPVLV